jgi:hypothetical protein
MNRKEKCQILLEAGFKPAYEMDWYDLRHNRWRFLLTMDNRVCLATWSIPRKEWIRADLEDELHKMPTIMQEVIIFNMEIF